MKYYNENIEKETLNNTYYRKVVFTTKNLQLVLMAIPPLTDIGLETHKKLTQFFRIESGKGFVVIGNKKYDIKDNQGIIIPPNTKHNIMNTSKSKYLKLYTIYSPAHHKPKTIIKNKN